MGRSRSYISHFHLSTFASVARLLVHFSFFLSPLQSIYDEPSILGDSPRSAQSNPTRYRTLKCNIHRSRINSMRKPLAAILFLLPHLSPLFFMSRARGYTEHRNALNIFTEHTHVAYTSTHIHTRAREHEGYHRIPFILYGNRSVNRTVLVCVIDAIRCFVAIIRSSIP